MSHFATSLTEILINVLIVAVWALGVLLRIQLDWQLYMVIAASVLLVWGPYAFLSYHLKHDTAFMHRLQRVNKAAHWENTRWWQKMQRWSDAPVQMQGQTEEQIV